MRKALILLALPALFSACSNPAAPSRHLRADSTARKTGGSPGDPCTDAQGRSGYIVTLGDKLVCQA